jgi:hypothetical protein
MPTQASTPKPKKPTPWAKSAAKKLLEFDISRQKDLKANGYPKEPHIVYVMRPEFQRYKYKNFRTNLNNLRKKVRKDREAATEDDTFVAKQLQKVPYSLRTVIGYGDRRVSYPRWPGHPAQHMLRFDMDMEKHLEMTPTELCASRPEYREFPQDVFRKHIHQELLAQKQGHHNTVEQFEDEDDSESES